MVRSTRNNAKKEDCNNSRKARKTDGHPLLYKFSTTYITSKKAFATGANFRQVKGTATRTKLSLRVWKDASTAAAAVARANELSLPQLDGNFKTPEEIKQQILVEFLRGNIRASKREAAIAAIGKVADQAELQEAGRKHRSVPSPLLLSAYEQDRLRNITRNNNLLRSLGFPTY